MEILHPALNGSRTGVPVSPLAAYRKPPSLGEPIQVGDIRLDQEKNLLQCGGREWLLRPKSVAVMAVLMRNSGRVISRGSLIAQVWGEDGSDHDATVRVYVHQLRRIVDGGESRRRHIVTVRSAGGPGGYLFRA